MTIPWTDFATITVPRCSSLLPNETKQKPCVAPVGFIDFIVWC